LQPLPQVLEFADGVALHPAQRLRHARIMSHLKPVAHPAQRHRRLCRNHHASTTFSGAPLGKADSACAFSALQPARNWFSAAVSSCLCRADPLWDSRFLLFSARFGQGLEPALPILIVTEDGP